jgi:hypothetical protein
LPVGVGLCGPDRSFGHPNLPLARRHKTERPDRERYDRAANDTVPYT